MYCWRRMRRRMRRPGGDGGGEMSLRARRRGKRLSPPIPRGGIRRCSRGSTGHRAVPGPKMGRKCRSSYYHTHNAPVLPPLQSAFRSAHNVVAYFLDECGVDVNTVMPLTKETVLHVLISYRPPAGKREAVRMLKYLMKEKGADPILTNVRG